MFLKWPKHFYNCSSKSFHAFSINMNSIYLLVSWVKSLLKVFFCCKNIQICWFFIPIDSLCENIIFSLSCPTSVIDCLKSICTDSINIFPIHMCCGFSDSVTNYIHNTFGIQTLNKPSLFLTQTLLIYKFELHELSLFIFTELSLRWVVV